MVGANANSSRKIALTGAPGQPLGEPRRGVGRVTLDAFFRQDYFDQKLKIKFRFLLVAHSSGFYSQAARRAGGQGVNKM